MIRGALVAGLALSLAVQCLADCVVSAKPTGPATDNTVVRATNFPDGGAAVQQAGNMWNASNDGGFPLFVGSIPTGTYSVLTVNYAGGSSPTIGECGSFPGANGGIDIYAFTRDPKNPSTWINCNPVGYAQNIAHELGHFLRLNDQLPGTACPTCIMAQVNGLTHSVQPCESGMADSQNQTTTEKGGDSCRVQKNCQCLPDDKVCLGTPIVINLGNNGYQLTGLSDPVAFDLNANGKPEETAWTAENAPMAFLSIDRNGNGRIDNGSELFGNHTPIGNTAIAVNGFEALRQYDANGDGQIDAEDPIWTSLRLWIDYNHDGVSQPNEIIELEDSPVISISLDYNYTGRRDAFGNQFRYQAVLVLRRAGRVVREPVYDIYFRRFND